MMSRVPRLCGNGIRWTDSNDEDRTKLGRAGMTVCMGDGRLIHQKANKRCAGAESIVQPRESWLRPAVRRWSICAVESIAPSATRITSTLAFSQGFARHWREWTRTDRHLGF
jgi:hypothetical protein